MQVSIKDMEQLVKGSYQRLSEPELIDPPIYFRFSNNQSAGQTIVGRKIKLQTHPIRAVVRIRLEPACVIKETNELVYHSRMMEKGKKYYVVWDNERFMLIKEDDCVNIYKFEEDED